MLLAPHYFSNSYLAVLIRVKVVKSILDVLFAESDMVDQPKQLNFFEAQLLILGVTFLYLFKPLCIKLHVRFAEGHCQRYHDVSRVAKLPFVR